MFITDKLYRDKIYFPHLPFFFFLFSRAHHLIWYFHTLPISLNMAHSRHQSHRRTSKDDTRAGLARPSAAICHDAWWAKKAKGALVTVHFLLGYPVTEFDNILVWFWHYFHRPSSQFVASIRFWSFSFKFPELLVNF